MHKVMFSLPDNLVSRMRSVIRDGERSRIVADLLEREIQHREKGLYERALLLEQNAELRAESKEWDQEFINDGLDNV
jgi:metal-responsive CopG/Arc/MetJ family transcriptional regulator